VISDADIGAPDTYLLGVLGALSEPDAGVATCAYIGRPVGGFWSRLSAMGVSYQFLPSVLVGVLLGLAKPCMGSTLALRSETLERIGGFESLKDVLADDYALGAAVRRLGLRSVLAPVLVRHSCSEATAGALFRHEVRWSRTIKGVDALGHAGSLLTHPVPLALLTLGLQSGSGVSWIGLFAAAAARFALKRAIDRLSGASLGSWWLLPLRDMVSILVFIASFWSRSVEWGDVKFHVTKKGDLRPV
jgi:ceramide glucosyltransferase